MIPDHEQEHPATRYWRKRAEDAEMWASVMALVILILIGIGVAVSLVGGSEPDCTTQETHNE